MLQDTPQTISRLRPDARNGLSLAHNGCFSRSLHSGVNGPDLLLRDLPACFTARSAFNSPATAGLPQPAAASSPRPVAVLRAGSLSCFLCLHSPPGLLPPSGSKHSTDSAALRLTFRLRPISSRSPPPVLFLGLAADHRSWFATFPETCCWKRAGPVASCTGARKTAGRDR